MKFFRLCLLIQIAQNLIKRSILAARILINSQKKNDDERKDWTSKETEERREERKYSPSLHSRCASARASPANLEWETTRYNESMRDRSHRICCYLNCSVSCWKNAHRYHAKYLMRAMMMMPMMRCRKRGLVLVADDLRCDRRGMIALKVTLRWKVSTVWCPFKNCNDDDVQERRK